MSWPGLTVDGHILRRREDVGAACGEVALMDQGRIAFHGTPAELIARGEWTGAAGDAPLERGYSAVLADARSIQAARS